MADDAVSVAPHADKVVLENDRVRVLDSHLKPGEKTEMHSHPDIVAHIVTGGKVKFGFPDGQSMDIDSSPGETMFMEGHSHSAENTGDSELHAILIELK